MGFLIITPIKFNHLMPYKIIIIIYINHDFILIKEFNFSYNLKIKLISINFIKYYFNFYYSCNFYFEHFKNYFNHRLIKIKQNYFYYYYFFQNFNFKGQNFNFQGIHFIEKINFNSNSN